MKKLVKKVKPRCKLCGKTICHFPCDNYSRKEQKEARKTCPCRYCQLDKRLGVA